MWNFKEMTNSELVSWYIMFLNGADYSDPESLTEWKAAEAEVATREESVKKDVEYLKSVI